MHWYIIHLALYDGAYVEGPFTTKKEALILSGNFEKTKRIDKGLYKKGKDYILTENAAIYHGFNLNNK